MIKPFSVLNTVNEEKKGDCPNNEQFTWRCCLWIWRCRKGKYIERYDIPSLHQNLKHPRTALSVKKSLSWACHMSYVIVKWLRHCANWTNKRGLSCAKLSCQITSFLGPMELFLVVLNCWIAELLNCWVVGLLNCWIVELLNYC